MASNVTVTARHSHDDYKLLLEALWYAMYQREKLELWHRDILAVHYQQIKTSGARFIAKQG